MLLVLQPYPTLFFSSPCRLHSSRTSQAVILCSFSFSSHGFISAHTKRETFFLGQAPENYFTAAPYVEGFMSLFSHFTSPTAALISSLLLFTLLFGTHPLALSFWLSQKTCECVCAGFVPAVLGGNFLEHGGSTVYTIELTLLGGKKMQGIKVSLFINCPWQNCCIITCNRYLLGFFFLHVFKCILEIYKHIWEHCGVFFGGGGWACIKCVCVI